WWSEHDRSLRQDTIDRGNANRGETTGPITSGPRLNASVSSGHRARGRRRRAPGVSPPGTAARAARASWASTPPGFSAKDWYPWGFRRPALSDREANRSASRRSGAVSDRAWHGSERGGESRRVLFRWRL